MNFCDKLFIVGGICPSYFRAICHKKYKCFIEETFIKKIHLELK